MRELSCGVDGAGLPTGVCVLEAKLKFLGELETRVHLSRLPLPEVM